MAFELDIPDEVTEYLDNLPLSDRGRQAIASALEHIAEMPDSFRTDPDNRVAPGHACLYYERIFTDFGGDGRIHVIRFVVDDRDATYGVLRIPYAEHQVGGPMP